MIEQIRSPHGDNYSYVIHDGESEEAVLVDPVATKRVEGFLEEKDLRAELVVNTHGHGDHTSGNHSFQLQDRVPVIAHTEATDRVGKVDRTVEDGDVIEAGSLDIHVLHTPGHTRGSIVLKTDDALVTGDTLFLAGCGNPKFGGDTHDLFETMRDKIRPLDDDLRVYPGHDYAQRNLEFVLDVDPDNDAARDKLNEIRGLAVDADEPRSILGEEKAYNPFLRFDEERFVHSLDLSAQPTYWDVFSRLRERRNQW